jgi:hypothetical protein
MEPRRTQGPDHNYRKVATWDTATGHADRKHWRERLSVAADTAPIHRLSMRRHSVLAQCPHGRHLQDVREAARGSPPGARFLARVIAERTRGSCNHKANRGGGNIDRRGGSDRGNPPAAVRPGPVSLVYIKVPLFQCIIILAMHPLTIGTVPHHKRNDGLVAMVSL